MGLQINGNIPPLGAQRQTQQAANRVAEGLTKLASQKRITTAADDAAGMAIAEGFRSQVRQFTQESVNLQSAVSALQTAEGGLESQQEAVGRVRELAVQASSGTLTADQRQAINAEAQQLLEQISETGAATEFNGTQLLDGSATSIPAGVESGTSFSVGESTRESLGIESVDLSTPEGAAAAVQQLDTASKRLTENRARVGAQENRLASATEQRALASQQAAESEAAIRDLDVARQVIEQSRNETVLQSGVAAMAQGNVQADTVSRLLR
jgi:flagellin